MYNIKKVTSKCNLIGGGLEQEGEMIEVVDLTLTEAKAYLSNENVNVPSEFLYGLMWFFKNKNVMLP